MPPADLLAGDMRDEIDEPVDRDHLLRADIERAGEVRAQQAHRAFEALVGYREKSASALRRPTSISSPSPPCGKSRQGPLRAHYARFSPAQRSRDIGLAHLTIDASHVAVPMTPAFQERLVKQESADCF